MNARHPEGFAPVRVTAVIIGGGHNGLAMSRCLMDHGIDHVVLERGEVANTWRTERWDSLRLLTPNWLCRLPGYSYDGDDPDGFMDMPGVIDFIDGYATAIAAPVMTQTTVTSVQISADGYRVATDRGVWQCRAVVLASGNFNIPKIPGISKGMPASIRQLAAKDYKNPSQLEEGGVLIVGASATGLQLAKEIHESGKPVTLAVGEHVRMPRTYRGKDIQYWMDAVGILDQHYRNVDDIDRARKVPSPQLVGMADRSTLDLNCLSAIGVQLVGRLSGVNGTRLQFSGALPNHCKLADLKMHRLLKTIDTWIEHRGLDGEAGPREDFAPTALDKAPRLGLDTAGGGVRTVLWATGYRPNYAWLHAPVFDGKGNLRHDGGVVDAPGMYAMGMTFMRRRKSSFIHGTEDDALDLSEHLSGYIKSGARRAVG